MLNLSHHSLKLMHFLVTILCQSYMVLEKRLSYRSEAVIVSLGDTGAILTNVYAKSTKLISSCHGIKNANNLSKLRFSVWYDCTYYCRGLLTQCLTCLLLSLCLEQLSATKTSGNGPMSGKMFYYRIRVSLALCLSF